MPETTTDQNQNKQETRDQNAAFSDLPVLREERIWGAGDFTAINVALAIATWAFLIGGSTAIFVGVRTGIAAIVIGNVIAVSLMAMATCLPSAKYGLEQYTALRSVFGLNGTRLIVFGFVAIIEMGWTAVLAIMFGRATTNISNSTFGTDLAPNSLFVTVMALIAIAASWLVLAKGPVSIKWMNNIVAPALAIVVVGMLILIFADRSWGELMTVKPIEPFGNKPLDFMIAIEFNLAAGFSWWPVMGSLARLTKTQRAAFWPNMVGLYAAAVVASIVGLLAALVLGDSDPTVWMIPLGGAILGVGALVFIAFANVTSIVNIIYSTCLAIRQTGGRAVEQIRWGTLTGVFFLFPAVGVFFPAALYDNFFQFLVWTAAVFAPLSGIYFVDFFFLRGRKINVRGLFQNRADSPYGYWADINPAAIVALLVGSVVYVVVLNPISLEHLGLFQFLSASMPSFVASGIVHWLLTHLMVLPSGRGGYDLAESEDR